MKLIWQILTGLMILIGADRVEAQALNSAEECKIVAQLAKMYKYEAVDPFLGRDKLSRRKEGAEAVELLDCKMVFVEAGLNTMPRQCDQDYLCEPFQVRFGRLRLDKDNPDAAVIEVDEYSEGIFAEGRRLSLVRVKGVWQVKADEGTWIT